MADREPLVRRRDVDVEDLHGDQRLDGGAKRSAAIKKTKAPRLASLDVFRGLSVFLMMLVDYSGSIFPVLAHSPWNGVHLADFVMPFFLFISGISLAIVYKKVSNRMHATWKVVQRFLYLLFLGILLQGGYLHGITSMTYGVDLERIRWLGILQRIAIGYLVAALCEIWLPCHRCRREDLAKNFILQWCVIVALCAIHTGLLYGLYVPDWKFSLPNVDHIYEVKCSTRGDLGPACNSAGMIDRAILGIRHMYLKPSFRNLEVCRVSSYMQDVNNLPSWCFSPFEPEGILSSLTAAGSCVLGLQYGHILVQTQDHKERLYRWSLTSLLFMVLGFFLSLLGIPLNKPLYTVSYLLVASGTSGITFCLLYVLVDFYGWRRITCVLEWMGKHSLGIFIIITSNIAVIAIQGFYWKVPENNIVHWIVSHVVHK